METKKIKICLGLLSNRGFKGKTVLSLLSLIHFSKEYDFHFAFIDSGYTIAENRNYLAVQAVKNECDYLLMTDDDMIFPPQTLEILLSRKKEIIGMPYNVKILPKEGSNERARNNVTYLPDDTQEGEVIEVLAIGAGVILISIDVFKKMNQPFFGFDSYENGMTKVGEDSWFCYKAADLGYKIWCERTLTGLGHIGDFIY